MINSPLFNPEPLTHAVPYANAVARPNLIHHDLVKLKPICNKKK